MKSESEIQVPSDPTDAKYPQWVYHVEIFVSALFFALSTLLAKYAQFDGVSSAAITFLRFAIGLAILLIYIVVARTKLEPKNPVVLILRGVFNLLAVFLFLLRHQIYHHYERQSAQSHISGFCRDSFADFSS